MKSNVLFGVVLVISAGLLAGCDGGLGNDATTLEERTVESAGATKIQADIWVDNWFSLAINGKPVIQDSVAYKTERSFNAERVTFNADFPLTIAFEFRDFMENDTGLEYIGSFRQQIGDGGAIAQFTDAETGAVIKVTDASWKCRVIHHAPVNAACAKESEPKIGIGSCQARMTQAPEGWMDHGFDDSQWAQASVHSTSTVRPKGGYDAIHWKQSAKLIWSKDLKRDNIVLCRTMINRR